MPSICRYASIAMMEISPLKVWTAAGSLSSWERTWRLAILACLAVDPVGDYQFLSSAEQINEASDGVSIRRHLLK
jgi:hypothetical protein